MAATAVVQLVYWQRTDPPFSTDTFRYLYMAKSFLDGDLRHAIHYHYPPLFPLLAAPFLGLTQTPEMGGRIACLAIAMLTALPVYFLTEKIFNRTVAALATLFLPFIFFHLPLIVDAQPLLGLLLYAAVAVGLISLRSKRPGLSFLTGIMFGLDSLAKMEAQAFFVLYFAILFVHLIVTRPPWRRAAGLVALLGLGYLLVLSPYLGAFYRDTGRFSINPKLAPLFYGHNEPDWGRACYSLRHDEHGEFTLEQRVVAEGDRQPFQFSLASYLFTNLPRLAPIYLDRLGFTIKSIIPAYLWYLSPPSGLLAGLLILIGLVRPGWTRAQFWQESYLISFGLLTIFSVPLFIPQMRFFTPLIPLLVILLGRGVEQLSLRLTALLGKFFSGLKAGGAQTVIVVILAILSLLPNLLLLYRYPREKEYHQFVADRRLPADWVRGHLEPGRKILSTWDNMPFWYLIGIDLDRDLAIPQSSLEDLIRYAREQNVEYLIYESGKLETRYPDLEPLLDPRFQHPALERVYAQVSPDGRYYVIYRIKPVSG